MRIPEEVTRYSYKEPTWFIARSPQATKKTGVSPVRNSPTRGSTTRNQSSQSLPRAFGISSGQGIKKNMNATRQDFTTNIHRQTAPDFTSVAMLINDQTYQQKQQPFHTVSPTYRRASIPSTSPISHAWGHRVVLNQVTVNPNDSSIGRVTSRGSQSCAHRQINEPVMLPLSMTVKPVTMDSEQQQYQHQHLMSHGMLSVPSTSASPLRVTSQSAYRLVPVDNNSRLLHQNSPKQLSKPLTSHLDFTAPPPTSVCINRHSHTTVTDNVDAIHVKEYPDSEVEQRKILEDMVEGPEASESRMYARGRFIYTPEETEINDNSCISFAY